MLNNIQNVTHDAGDALARALFTAELGMTGLTWEKLSDIGQDDYKRKAARVLESWWDPERPYVVIDLADGEMWVSDIGYRAGVLHRHSK